MQYAALLKSSVSKPMVNIDIGFLFVYMKVSTGLRLTAIFDTSPDHGHIRKCKYRNALEKVKIYVYICINIISRTHRHIHSAATFNMYVYLYAYAYVCIIYTLDIVCRR